MSIPAQQNTCPWSAVPEHSSNDGCILIKSDANLVSHVFNSTSYTMSSKTGLPIYNETEFLGSVELSNYKFSKNNPRCTVISSKFDGDDFIHASEFKVTTAHQFWWFLDSTFKLWQRFTVNHAMYPRDKTMLDFLVPRNPSRSSFLFLKPIHYTDGVDHPNFAMSTMVYNLYRNSYAHLMDSASAQCNKPPKLYCGHGCKFNQMPTAHTKWWAPLRSLFGKNMYIHSICCASRKNMTADWYEFVRSLVARRRAECEDNASKTSNKNQINYLHKKWLASIGRDFEYT